MSSQFSPFYNKIMWFWLVIHMLIRLERLKMPFLAIFDVFLPIFSERGVPKNFFDPKIFFSENLTQSQFRMHYLDSITCYSKIHFFSLYNLKSHFPLFSNINWLQAKKWGSKTPEGGMVFTPKVIKILSILDLRGTKGSKKQSNLKLQNCHDNLQHWPD